MADCPSDTSSDCLPAGSNVTDPCSPCYEPSKETFLSDLAALARQVCAVGNQVKSWNQRLARFTNRMDRLERALNAIPDAEETVLGDDCSNLDETDSANLIKVCNEGVTQGLSTLEDQCTDILGGDDGIWRVIPHGSTLYKVTPAQTLTTSWSTQNFTALTDYDEILENHPCGIQWAIVDYQCFMTPLSSTNAGTSVAALNGMILGTIFTEAGGAASFGGTALVPMTSKLLAFSVSNSFSGGFTYSSSFLRLRGFAA